MGTYSTKRMAMEAALEHASNNNFEIVDPIKGFGLDLNPGDQFTMGEIFLTTMERSVLNEDGTFAKGAYWVSEAKVKQGTEKYTFDVPAATFVRCSRAREVAQLGESYRKVATSSVETPIRKGRELFEALMKEAGLTEAQKSFNRALARAEGSLEKLKGLNGKTLKVIGKSRTVYTLAFNRKDEADWGSKPSHWASTKVLFFEVVK